MSTIRARIDARKKKKKDTTTSFDFLLFSFDYVRFFATEEWGDSVLFLKQYDKRWGEQSFLVGRKMGVESNSLQKHLRHLGGVPEIRHRSSWPTSSCSSAGRKGNTRR